MERPTNGASDRASATRDGESEGATATLLSEPLERVESELDASGDGLTTEEAARRLEDAGPNALPEEHESELLKFLRGFWGPIPWMIEAALILAAALSDITDVIVIGTLLVANAVIGFWHEHQAGNAIAALKKRLATTARAQRDGTWQDVEARELVPGDVIRIRLGDVVPADARLLPDCELELDQSALTGESLPVKQSEGGVAYSGSVVTSGEGDALVVATRSRSFFGRTAELVTTAKTVSHFQRAVLTIGRYVIVITVALVAATLIVSLLRGNDSGDAIEFALVLVVAGVPVSLPAVLSVTMAIGASNLAKRDVVVAHLPAVEELAGVDVLCSDKTGTLTENKLTVGDPVMIGNGAAGAGEQVVLAAALASREEDRDPIDLAVLAAVDGKAEVGYEILNFKPFDPVGKLSEAEVSGPEGRFRVVKGAPQAIVGLVAENRRAPIAAEVGAAVDGLAERGFRALAVGRTSGNDGWEVIGVLPLSDPPRPDSKETIASARELGLEVKMVTGDHLAIAREVAGAVGLSTDIVDAATIEDLPEDELPDEVERADGFAQVFPEHKFSIVKALQACRHIVGMTGDGVNDAPALKQADVGIAVSGATDAARAAADIVLLTPGLSVIVAGLRASRQIFSRMVSYALYRISDTLSLLAFVAVILIASNEQPVTAIMVLLIAIMNDAAILSIAYDRAPARHRPQAWHMGTVFGVASVIGLYLVAFFTAFYFLAGDALGLELDERQTLMYLMISVLGHLTIFTTRVRGRFTSLAPARVLVAAVFGTQALATLIALVGFGLVTPLPVEGALVVWGVALIAFLVEDQVKLLAYRIFERPQPEPATEPEVQR